jgi:hypothetical protein
MGALHYSVVKRSLGQSNLATVAQYMEGYSGCPVEVQADDC